MIQAKQTKPANPDYLPLIFALKDLRIQFYPDELNAPDTFSCSTRLMRADAVLPVVDETVVEGRLGAGPISPPPKDPVDALMRAGCPGWPEDTLVAVRGITAFGAGNNEIATACALYALRLNSKCMLARQLLQLLSEKKDPRIPFSNQEAEVKDVLTKMAGQRSSEQSTRPVPMTWWRRLRSWILPR